MKIDVYTDGSCNKSYIGGWAYYLECKQGEEIVARRAFRNAAAEMTNQRAELLAVLSAISNFTQPATFAIHSDSAYVVNCFHEGWYVKWLMNGWTNSKGEAVANQGIWARILHEMEKHTIEFIKVKGHNGHVQNEYADELARLAVADYLEQKQASELNLDKPFVENKPKPSSLDGQLLGVPYDPTPYMRT